MILLPGATLSEISAFPFPLTARITPEMVRAIPAPPLCQTGSEYDTVQDCRDRRGEAHHQHGHTKGELWSVIKRFVEGVFQDSGKFLKSGRIHPEWVAGLIRIIQGTIASES